MMTKEQKENLVAVLTDRISKYYNSLPNPAKAFNADWGWCRPPLDDDGALTNEVLAN